MYHTYASWRWHPSTGTYMNVGDVNNMSKRQQPNYTNNKKIWKQMDKILLFFSALILKENH